MEKNRPWPQPWPQKQEPKWPSNTLPTVTVNCGHTEANVVELKPARPQSANLRPAWQPGQSGNPKGRPKSCKHKISELARSIFAEDFAQHGRATLELVRRIDPIAYMKLVLVFVPKELILKQEMGKMLDYSELAKEENHAELNEYIQDRERHAKIESVVDGFDTKYKN